MKTWLWNVSSVLFFTELLVLKKLWSLKQNIFPIAVKFISLMSVLSLIHFFFSNQMYSRICVYNVGGNIFTLFCNFFSNQKYSKNYKLSLKHVGKHSTTNGSTRHFFVWCCWEKIKDKFSREWTIKSNFLFIQKTENVSLLRSSTGLWSKTNVLHQHKNKTQHPLCSLAISDMKHSPDIKSYFSGVILIGCEMNEREIVQRRPLSLYLLTLWKIILFLNILFSLNKHD